MLPGRHQAPLPRFIYVLWSKILSTVDTTVLALFFEIIVGLNVSKSFQNYNFRGWTMLIDIYLIVNFSNLWLDSDRRDAIECQEVYIQPLCCSQKRCQLPSSSVTCRVGSSSVQQIFFISTRDALKGVLPVHVLSESLLCANFLSVPCIIVWNALHVIFMCILYPLPDFQAVRFSDVWPGLRKTLRIAAVWSLNIIELFQNECPSSDGAESCKLH